MSFGRQVREFSLKADLKIDVVLRKVLIDAFSSLLALSPVDTGRFRASWRISAGAPDLSTEGPDVHPGFGRGAPLPARPEDALKAASVDTKNNTVFFLTNNLPYAKFLEDGGSSQNPAGILSQTFNYITARLDAIVSQVK